MGAKARIGHDRLVAIDPIYTQRIVTYALGLFDFRRLRHLSARRIEVRGGRRARQPARWSTLRVALAVVFLVPSLANGIPASEAVNHVGESVTIEGFVQQVMCSPRACLMSFEAGWAGFVATVPSGALDRIGDVKRFERRSVRLRGVVEDRQGKLRLELTDPSRIELMEGGLGRGSHVVKTDEKISEKAGTGDVPRQRAGPSAPQVKTRVQVSGGLADGGATSQLSSIVRDLEEEAAVSGTAGGDRASHLAVEGLRDRVAMQAHTIQTLEEELAQMRERLSDLEERPMPSLSDLDEPAPAVDPWIVPAKRRLKLTRPRTGWSTKRLLRELGSPREVKELSSDTTLWIYGVNQSVTVKRGRVLTASGF